MLTRCLKGIGIAINAGAIAIISSLLILTAKFECGRQISITPFGGTIPPF